MYAIARYHWEPADDDEGPETPEDTEIAAEHDADNKADRDAWQALDEAAYAAALNAEARGEVGS